MKQIIKNYSFDKTAKTVTFSDFSSIRLDRILLITNVTTNTLVYQFNNSLLGGTVATNILTLTYNTSSMSNTDKLQIFYETLDTDPVYEAQPINDNGGSITIDGSVSISSSTLPTLAATSTKQSDGSQKTQVVDGSGNVVGATSNALDINIKSGTVSLPTGAATSAKQPALGTAGSASSDVITVQGIASGTAQPISGTVTSNMGTTNGLALDATITGGTQQTKITDGTNIGNVLKSDGTAAGQNAQLVGGTGYSTATLTLNAGAPNTAWFDLLNYAWVSVGILTNTTPATLTFQAASDGSQTNPVSVNLLSPSGTTTASTSTSTTATFHGPRSGRYFRVSSNVAGGNTVTLVMTFYTEPSTLQAITAAQGGTWTVGSNSAVGSATPANGFLVAVSNSGTLASVNAVAALGDTSTGSGSLATGSFLYNGSTWERGRSIINGTNSTGVGLAAAGLIAQFDDVSPTAITENQFGNIRMSANRNIYQTIRDAAGNERGANVTSSNALVVDSSSAAPALAPSGTALNTYSVHITTNATTTPTSSTAYISSISISSEVAGTTSTVTVQDKQGTPLKLVNGFSTTSLTTTPTVVNFQTPAKMVSGIDIVTAGAVAATVDVWVNYYQ